MSSPLDWAKLGTSVLGGIGSSLFGSEEADRNNRMQQAYLALAQAQQAQQARQFGLTSAENQREFDATQGLNTQKFQAGQENTQFGRQQNARFAAVRAPVIAGLGSGVLLKNNPNWAKYAAVGQPAAPSPSVMPVSQTPHSPQ